MERIPTSFTDLICWQKARELSGLIYELTSQSRDYVLIDQIRRAAISTMNNIAEGYGRSFEKEKVRFLDIALASALEITSMTYLMEDIAFCSQDKIDMIRNQSKQVYRLTKGLSIYYRNCNLK